MSKLDEIMEDVKYKKIRDELKKEVLEEIEQEKENNDSNRIKESREQSDRIRQIAKDANITK